MPWHVEPEHPNCGGGFAVVKDEDGEVVACHDSEASAEAQVRALYAAEAEEEAAELAGAAAAEMLAAITQEERDRWAEQGIALPDGSYPIPDREFLRRAIGALGRASQNDEYDRVKRHIIKRARTLDALDLLPDDWDVTAAADDEEEMEDAEYVAASVLAMTAAAAGLAPETPPGAWFEDPKLAGPTPLTITSDGRVYGHAALWGTCHTGVSGICQEPPHSASGYRYFKLGSRETTDGEVAVGRVTASTGHASIAASRKQAVAHYDNTGTVVAHVNAGEDAHGIWIAGALNPDADAAQVRTLKAASVSGDWRSVNGALEMVGLLAVNVPGFPVPRAEARVASGVPQSLVAAGQALLSDADYDRRMRLLAARALGEQELVDMALGTTPVEKRMRTMRPRVAAPVAQVVEQAAEAAPGGITININVPTGEPPLPQLTAAQEREVGMQVDFFRTHGYWPDEQLGGGVLDPTEMPPVMAAATALVKRPDQTVALRQRLIDQGFIIDAGVTAA